MSIFLNAFYKPDRKAFIWPYPSFPLDPSLRPKIVIPIKPLIDTNGVRLKTEEKRLCHPECLALNYISQSESKDAMDAIRSAQEGLAETARSAKENLAETSLPKVKEDKPIEPVKQPDVKKYEINPLRDPIKFLYSKNNTIMGPAKSIIDNKFPNLVLPWSIPFTGKSEYMDAFSALYTPNSFLQQFL